MVDALTSTTSATNSTTRATGSSTLGKDDFLKVLITQLRNQDPMQPLQDKDFIAQMAQFSSVEQLMDLSANMGKLSQNLGLASNMIGKNIEWTETSGKDTVLKSGLVSSIVVRGGIQYAIVDDQAISLDQVLSISAPPVSGGGTTSE